MAKENPDGSAEIIPENSIHRHDTCTRCTCQCGKRAYHDFSHGKVVSSEKYIYGRDVTAILRDVMHTEVRPKEVVEKKALFYEVLEKGEFSRAEELLADLEKVLGAQDEDILRMQVMLDMERL